MGWIGLTLLGTIRFHSTGCPNHSEAWDGRAGGTVGYWEEFLFPREAHSASRRAVLVMSRIGVVLTDETEAGVLSGNLEILVEPFYGRFQNRFSADTVGVSLGMKYNLLSFGRWMPFWDVGVGILWTDLAPRIAEDSAK